MSVRMERSAIERRPLAENTKIGQIRIYTFAAHSNNDEEYLWTRAVEDALTRDQQRKQNAINGYRYFLRSVLVRSLTDQDK